jgi:hypothetical protein
MEVLGSELEWWVIALQSCRQAPSTTDFRTSDPKREERRKKRKEKRDW